MFQPHWLPCTSSDPPLPPQEPLQECSSPRYLRGSVPSILQVFVSFLIMPSLRLLRVPLDCKEIKPVNPKGNQSWIFIGRAEGEAPVLWPPDVKNWLLGKDPDAGKYWKQEKGTTEYKMVGWHHWLNGHEFEQAAGDGEGQGTLACCNSWGHKETDTTERLNWTEHYFR